MKKSTLLTVASVGAVALTSAMTFAAWDNLTAETTTTVTFNKVNVSQKSDLTLIKDTRELDAAPSATGQMEVKIEDKGQEFSGKNNTKLEIVPTISGEGVTQDNYTVAIYSGTDTTGTLLVGGVDDTPTYGETGETYTVVVTPNSNTDVDKAVTVKLTSTLSAKAGS